MAFLSTEVRDDGLTILDALTSPELHITSAEATTRANALTLSLGQKVTPTISAPQAGTTGEGRKVVISAITDGDVDTNGTATHWALIDSTILQGAQTLSASQVVTSGNTFTLTAIDIEIPDSDYHTSLPLDRISEPLIILFNAVDGLSSEHVKKLGLRLHEIPAGKIAEFRFQV